MYSIPTFSVESAVRQSSTLHGVQMSPQPGPRPRMWSEDGQEAIRPSSSLGRWQGEAEDQRAGRGARPHTATATAARLSFSLHDLTRPWTGNTNFINGFYKVRIAESVDWTSTVSCRSRRETQWSTAICTQCMFSRQPYRAMHITTVALCLQKSFCF